jgi:hypothetical protein
MAIQITWYEIEGDRLVGESILNGVDLSEMKILFNVLPNEEMVYVYPVSEAHIQYLQQFTKHKIDLKQYAYFVEGSSS